MPQSLIPNPYVQGKPHVLLNIILLLLGIFAGSTAVIMIKASTVHPILLASLRLLLAAVLLAPLFVRDYRRHRATYTWAHLRDSLAPAVMLACHFMTWITGARLTPAANASLIVNLAPIAMPFSLALLAREHVTATELKATALALGGVLFLTAADLNFSPQYFWGDVTCFVSMLFFSVYLTLGRRNRHFASVWLYVVPLYAVAGLLCLIVALFFVNPIQPYSARDLLLILGLAVIPTIGGHSLLNRAMKYFRGQIVSIVNMGQFIFAGMMAYLLFHETPDWTFYVAGVVLAMAVWLVVRSYKLKVES